MLTNPSDIGFDGSKYILPELNIEEVYIETKRRNNGELFNSMAVSATTFHKELNATMTERMSKVSEMVNNSSEKFIIWIGHDEKGKILKELIPGSIEVKGSDQKSYKKEKLLGFAKGEFRVLITKLKIAQFGLNYQNCHNQIFASLDFSFEATYQGIRRSWRFGQTDKVNIYLIVTDTMQNVRKSIIDKQKAFETMQKAMSEATNRNIKHLTKLVKMEVQKSYKSDSRCY